MNDTRDENTLNIEDNADFDLSCFFPYLVRIYYRAVSTAVSDVYTKSYGMSVSEWRTMAVLGLQKSLSASEIVARSSMDKVNVSRAIKALQARGFLKRQIDQIDKRKISLKLTDKGNAAFKDLISKVTKVEENCLSGLSDEEQDTLITLMGRVQNNAEKLVQIKIQQARK